MRRRKIGDTSHRPHANPDTGGRFEWVKNIVQRAIQNHGGGEIYLYQQKHSWGKSVLHGALEISVQNRYSLSRFLCELGIFGEKNEGLSPSGRILA